MQDSWYSFDVSPGWVVLALAVALGLSVLLYSKKGMPWSQTPNVLLGFLRFSAIFLIILLILNPLLQLNINEVEEPTIIFAIDNSESIRLRSSNEQIAKLKTWISTTSEQLSDDYPTEFFHLSAQTADTLSFDAKTSNLSNLLNRISSVYEGRSIGAVVLISDGIINQGQSPAYQNFGFPVYTLGVGDTVPPKDIALSSIRNNQVAYQGNQFPVNIVISQKGYDGESVNVSIREGTSILRQQQINLNSRYENIQFLLNADEPGLKRLSVKVDSKEGESTTANNQRDIFVDVIEGKEKILIMAPAPHPDINAIRSVLDEAANYETVLYIPGIHERPASDDFDVVIEHQAFSRQNYPDYQSTGTWYILGSRTNLKAMSESLGFLKIDPKGNQKDQTKPAYNASFSKFQLQENLLERLTNYPPIQVPFGEYQASGPVETLFFQQVGNVKTDRPLLTFFDDGTSKMAVLTGTGIWQWKLQESSSEENADLFRESILKTIQFLGIKATKTRFVAKPRQSNYTIGDRIFIDTEVYNEVYQRSYGNTIKLSIINEDDSVSKYEMVDAPANNSFNLGTMQPGIYKFEATVDLNGKTFAESGSFAVKDIQLEELELTANHNLLRRISDNTGGYFYAFANADHLPSRLQALDLQGVIRTSERYFPLINSLWIILVIAVLLSTEWFLRKYLGAY